MGAPEFDHDFIGEGERPIVESTDEKRVLTPEEVRSLFRKNGVSITSWAAANRFPTSMVFDLLAGRKQGLRGNAHRAAVMLGLKHGEIVTDPAKALQ